MNLASGYLGLPLRSPLIVGASPVCDDVNLARQCEAAGAGAVVMRSLFSEQMSAVHSANAAMRYCFSPEAYLEQVRALKRELTIPVIASLNGHTPGVWADFAPQLQEAGADAIELNFYEIVVDPAIDADLVETDMLETVGEVVGSVDLPVAVKLSPFHVSIAQHAIAMELAGASAVVVFNRFFQPDVDTAAVTERPTLHLSDPSELLLRLRWLSVLSPILRGTIAASGGVHTSEDVVKAILSGAHAVQVTSALLRHGPRVFAGMRKGLELWMRKHGHGDLDTFRGQLNMLRVENPEAFERANYIRVLQSWQK